MQGADRDSKPGVGARDVTAPALAMPEYSWQQACPECGAPGSYTGIYRVGLGWLLTCPQCLMAFYRS